MRTRKAARLETGADVCSPPQRLAAIYCRVSHKKQKNDGDGLQSQEHRCREYATARGYVVPPDAVFYDDVSGGGDFMKRPGMVALLNYLGAHERGYVVIFDDLKRFARDTIFHLKLRQELATYGANAECLNFKFEDTPEGEFIETIMAAQGQLERLQNRRQTLQKMKARVERGYYVFAVPVGYRYKKVASHGRMLVRDEPLASVVQEALEGYASGRFAAQVEVRRWLEAQPGFPKSAGDRVRNMEVTRLLTRSVYAGYVEAPAWGVSLRKGHHQPLISIETYQRIQERLRGNARAPSRQELILDFPLRGSVVCADCGTPLTACWAKGKYSRYAYYYCPKFGCRSRSKTIPRAQIEGDFATLLSRLRPAPELFETVTALFEDHWNERLRSASARKSSLESELSTIESQVEQFIDRHAAATVPAMLAAYEKRIVALEARKASLRAEVENCGRPLQSFDEALQTPLRFLANPCNFWESPQWEHKRAVLKLAFADRLAYRRETGFQTPELSLPFKLLAELEGSKSRMARPERFELPTLRFEA